jgi:Polysaccharide biosynthesis/export protein/SLBB domain
MAEVNVSTRAPPRRHCVFSAGARFQGLAKARTGLGAFVILLAIGPLLAACDDVDFGPVTAYAPPPAVYTVASYLQAGDKLGVIVYGEASLTGDYEINPDGTITMPLIGAIKVGGQTRNEIERIITYAYVSRRFLKAPQVTISEVTYRPIYILGEVATPGKYPFVIGLDALTAIATAGGFTVHAGRGSVMIRHDNERVWRQYALVSPLPIEPGDLIRVSESYF